MTERQVRSFVLAALAMIPVGLALATKARAQEVTYYYSGPTWNASPVHYHRVYQGTTWHWTPRLGWHTHDHYVDVPHWTAVSVVAAQPISAPEVNSSARDNRPTLAKKESEDVAPQLTSPVPVAPKGKFVVLNHSGVNRYVSINGARFYAAPGRTELWIPRGIVEAYLPYWESPKLLGTSFWRWTGQHYEMSLHIRG